MQTAVIPDPETAVCIQTAAMVGELREGMEGA
jgi:hypothetical protein